MPGLIPYILILLALVGVFFVFINMKQKQKIKSDIIHKFEKHGKVFIDGKYLLYQVENKTYEILFYKIAQYHELTINSKMIWEVHTSSRSQLINQTSFLASPYEKIIILYPIDTKIKRFINENEMVFIDYQSSFYNMRLVKYNEVSRFLSEVDL